MPSIPTDPASYYATYNLGSSERRDSAGNVLPNPASGSTLPTHAFFQQQQQQQAQSQHVAVTHYHPHQPSSSHASVAQYHAQQQHAHVTSLPASVHHVAAVVDVGNPYHSSGFSPYAQSNYHAQQQAVSSHAGTFDTAGGASVDSALTTPSAALHAPKSPTLVHQHQQQHQQVSSDSNLHFECILEAPTAAAQRADESPLTYLNKGQLYGVTLVNKTLADTFYSTTLRIAFHEDSHRRGAATYWNFWLNQQESPRSARAIELDKAGSTGVVAAESKQFDRVTFQWHGRRGAKVMIRFNCLSTDFSRIKGVKGIPLRIHLDTHYAQPSPASGVSDFAASMSQFSSPISPFSPPDALGGTQGAMSTVRAGATVATTGVSSNPVSPASATHMLGSSDTQQLRSVAGPFSVSIAAAAAAAQVATTHAQVMAGMHGSGLVADKIIERCYARIKLFRDKGAERKNKDDQRHLEKLWEKKKAGLALKNAGASTPQQQMAEFTMAFAPVLQITPFLEYTLTGDECDEEPVAIEDMWSVGGGAGNAGLDPEGSAISPSMAGISSMNI
ncbi:hypothetical protein GGI10_003341, partial [Coemansia sp. RSA 2530]